MTVQDILIDVTRRLDAIGVSYVIGGSVASSVWGQMRQTNDVDLAVQLSTLDAEKLTEAFGDPYFVSPTEVQEALLSSAEFRQIQILQLDEAFKIDLFVIGDDPYSASEIERGRLVEIQPDVWLRFCASENIVIAKLRWFLLGNSVSDRQWHDIVQVLEIQKGSVDIEYLGKWAEHFGLVELLDTALAQASSNG